MDRLYSTRLTNWLQHEDGGQTTAWNDGQTTAWGWWTDYSMKMMDRLYSIRMSCRRETTFTKIRLTVSNTQKSLDPTWTILTNFPWWLPATWKITFLILLAQCDVAWHLFPGLAVPSAHIHQHQRKLLRMEPGTSVSVTLPGDLIPFN